MIDFHERQQVRQCTTDDIGRDGESEHSAPLKTHVSAPTHDAEEHPCHGAPGNESQQTEERKNEEKKEASAPKLGETENGLHKMESGIDLTLPIAAPSLKGTREKKVVIGFMPPFGAEGEEFTKAHDRFDDGVLLHYLCDALVYTGNEISIGGRRVAREEGEKLWIVSFGTEENPGNRLIHSETPNVLLSGARLYARPLELKLDAMRDAAAHIVMMLINTA